mgnify:CR=1 FL=1
MRLKFLPSFVKRRGRITKRQEESLSFLKDYSVSNIKDIHKESRDYDQCCLEIGFGNAEHLIKQSENNPKTLFIGSEVYMSGICLLYTSPSPRDLSTSRMPSSA